MKLFFSLKPRTVIEIGSHHGGGALWFADLLTIYGVAAHVYSVDLHSQPIVADPRITFMRVDARDLSSTLTDEFVRSLPRPLLAVEDSAHYYETCSRLFQRHDISCLPEIEGERTKRRSLSPMRSATRESQPNDRINLLKALIAAVPYKIHPC